AELGAALRTGDPGAAGGIKARTACKGCHAPLVVDLAFCPACGRDTAWGLRPGPYAVQVSNIADDVRCAGWLERRDPAALGARGAPPRRVRVGPVPRRRVGGVSQEGAGQPLAEAADTWCAAEMIRARAVLGARLRPSGATLPEVLVAAGLHAGVVCVLAALL